METKKYERIEKEKISHIEIWEECLRIHFTNKEVMDLNVNQN